MATATAGCNSFLPNSGPGREAVRGGAAMRVEDLRERGRLSYALIPVSQPVVNLAQADDRRPVFERFRAATRPADVRIGVGDILGITIFESSNGGLFVPPDAGARNGNFVNLPSQQVDQGGNISVPFAGTIRAAGQTTRQVQRVIESRLANRALEPQAVVSINEHRSNIVSVLGDVNSAARFPMDPGGERLLGAIARAGGPKFPAWETYVTVQRAGTTERALLSEVARRPEMNLELRAGDSVYVSHEQRYYVALGATAQGQTFQAINRRIPFEDTALSLTEGLAKAGGLQDDRANPRAVFLFRVEPRTTVERMMRTAGTAMQPGMPATIPTVYLVDLSDPASFFYANQMPLRHQDVIFVANSPSTDLSKFLSIILPSASSTAGFRAGFQ